MNVILAKNAGFCAGVARSVAAAEEALAKYGAVWCIGDLIHNRDEMRRLAGLGLRTVRSADEVPSGAPVLIRAHGEPPETYAVLREKGAIVLDTTCGKVEDIHRIARETAAQGGTLIVFGDAAHPEVRGIAGWCSPHFVVNSPEELEKLLKSDRISGANVVNLVFQSTETQYNFANSQKIQKKICTNGKIFDTICDTTQSRQSEAHNLAERCDAMVVVGDPNSANSRHLAEICAEICGRVFFVNSAEDLDVTRFAALDTVGVTAGASVPARIFKEVKQKMDEMKEMNQVTEAVTEAAEQIVTETANEIPAPEVAAEAVREAAAEAAPEAAAEPVPEAEKSFEELLEDSIKTISNGDIVKGIVAAITPTEVTVDLGTKHSGYIPVEEFEDGQGTKIEDLVHIGDEVDASVVRVNDVEGTVMLSKKRLDTIRNWEDVEAACENESVVEGIVTEENKGGVVVNVKGIRVFVPASQSGLPRNADLSQLVKQTVKLRITEVNKGRRRVVGSIRLVTAAAHREAVARIWEEIEVGKHYDGVVKSLTSYGAFVDIGGVDGMVHVSELSWKHISKPADVVAVGDKINVYVISFDKENHKISLGYKDPADNPWDKFMNNYKVGDIASVTIVKLMTFGAFAEILPGVDGLIHISQIANRRIATPGEVLTVGDVVDAKITVIDEETHKVSLSIRALSEPKPAPAREELDEREAAPKPREDALVYEVSETGESTGIAPEADELPED